MQNSRTDVFMHFMRWIRRNADYHFLRKNRRIRSQEYEKRILISSMGRSGSTWFSEILNFKNEYRELFEPFRSDRVDLASAFTYPKYIRAHNQEARFLDPARTILSGHFTHPWTDIEDYSEDPPAHLLIKDIRSNLFLPWIHKQFPELPLILLIRHPNAVVRSWIDCGFGDGSLEREQFLAQEDLMEDFLAPYAPEYRLADSPWERLIFYWCIFNLLPLQKMPSGSYHLVFYEQVMLDPEQEMRRLFRFLGEKFDQTVIDQINKPSRTTTRTSALLKEGTDRLNNWKKRVSPEDQAHTQRILKIFGLEGLYSEDSVPNMSFAYQLKLSGDEAGMS